LNLLRQFTGRRDDHGTHTTARSLHEALQDGQYERCRLAGAGLRDANDITPAQSVGNDLFLDRGRRMVSEVANTGGDLRMKAKSIERH